MHEVALRKQMITTLEQYKRNPRPEGAGVRQMTEQEIKDYAEFTAANYRNFEMLDNGSEDRNPATGVIDIQNRSVDDGITDSFPRESTESFQAQFGGRSKTYEAIQDLSNRPLYETSDRGYSSTNIEWAEQNIGFIAGISMSRRDNTVQTTEFFVDRFRPENSRIRQSQPMTARQF